MSGAERAEGQGGVLVAERRKGGGRLLAETGDGAAPMVERWEGGQVLGGVRWEGEQSRLVEMGDRGGSHVLWTSPVYPDSSIFGEF